MSRDPEALITHHASRITHHWPLGRHTSLKVGGAARYGVETADADAAAALGRIADFQAQRTATQPRQLSAGSVFANPPDDYAGRLIEATGLKAARIGGCAISAQHANFIVNVGRGTAGDVYGLVRLAQDAVWGRF